MPPSPTNLATGLAPISPTIAPAPRLGDGLALPTVALGQVSHHVARMAEAEGADRVVLRLDPPHLGAVTVDIATRNGDVHVVMRVEAPLAAQGLAAQRDQLRAALDAHGLALAGFDIRQDRRDTRQERHRDGGGATRAGALTGLTASASPANELAPREGVLFL